MSSRHTYEFPLQLDMKHHKSIIFKLYYFLNYKIDNNISPNLI